MPIVSCQIVVTHYANKMLSFSTKAINILCSFPECNFVASLLHRLFDSLRPKIYRLYVGTRVHYRPLSMFSLKPQSIVHDANKIATRAVRVLRSTHCHQHQTAFSFFLHSTSCELLHFLSSTLNDNFADFWKV